MTTLRSQMIRLAATLPAGGESRRQVLALLQEKQARMTAPFRVIPSKSDVEYDQIQEIQPDFAKLERWFGDKTELVSDGWVWGAGGPSKEGVAARSFIQANMKRWESLSVGTGSAGGFKSQGSSLLFPNGESVGIFTHDDTYEDSRRYGHGATYHPATSGPSISDPKFPDWYFAEYIRLPSFVLSPSMFKPLELFLDETRVDPSAWVAQSGTKNFSSGKQRFFFLMRLKDVGEILQRKAPLGLNVLKFQVRHGRQINSQTGKPWVSSVKLVLAVQPPKAREPLASLTLVVNYDGLAAKYEVNKKYKVDYD